MTARRTSSRALTTTGALLCTALLAAPAQALQTAPAPAPGAPTVSPAQTPSPSEEPGPSPSEEPTPTPSPSDDPTPSPSPSEEPSPTPSPSPSQDPTPTPSPSEEPTPTPSPSPSGAPSPSPSQKPAPSPTQRPTMRPVPTGPPAPSPDPSTPAPGPRPSSSAAPSTPFTPFTPSPPSAEALPSRDDDGRTPSRGPGGTTPGPSGQPLDLEVYPLPGSGLSTQAQQGPSLGSSDRSRRSPMHDATETALSGLQNTGRLLEDEALSALEYAQREGLQRPAGADGLTEQTPDVLAEAGERSEAVPDTPLARLLQAPGWVLGLMVAGIAVLGGLAARWALLLPAPRRDRRDG